MWRTIAGVIAGLAIWIAVVVVAGLIMRPLWPAYAAVAETMAFTLPMKIARLSIGAVATIASGWVAGTVAGRQSALITGIVLLVVFVPEHISLWSKFPIWYHLTFLGSLVPLSLLGRRLNPFEPEARIVPQM